jgi:transcriptional regulator with XRE-family HTH domain
MSDETAAIPVASIYAREWREMQNLTRGELADLVGYSVSQIMDLESGVNRKTGAPLGLGVMRRYTLACARVDNTPALAKYQKGFEGALLILDKAEDRLIECFAWGR